MADQEDFPNIYIDASASGPSYVGSEADPYDQFSDINWDGGGDNDVSVAVAANEDVTINLNMGEEWREVLTVGTSGSAAHPITIREYGSGAAPIVNGSDVVATWEATSGTDYTGDANLLSYHYMEEASGVRYDETANNVDFADNNTVTRTATHQQGTYAASFAAATSEYLSAADAILPATWPHSDGASDTDYTVGGWFYFDTDNTNVSMFGKQWSHDVFLSAASKLSARIRKNDTTDINLVGGTTITAGTWWHLAVRVDVGGNATLVVNGADDTVTPTACPDLFEDASPFIVGKAPGVGAYFNGYVDEFFMFDRVVSDADLLKIHDDRLDGSAGGVADVWEATLTTEPNQVFFDGTRGTVQASVAACDAEFDWHWAANVLYIYSAGGDPDTEYTDIEASQRIRCIYMGGTDYITVEDIKFKNANLDNIGIDEGSDNVTIDGVTSDYAYWRGIQISTAAGTCSNTTVKNSTLSYSGGNGVWIGTNTNTTLIQNNTVHHNCQLAIDGSQHDFTAGIKSNDSTCVGLIVENNTVYSEGIGVAGDTGAGIWSDTDVPGPIFRYNKVYDCEFYGLHFELTSDGECYYNVSYGNHSGFAQRSDTTASSRNKIYNNVFYNNDNYGMALWYTGATENQFCDNLIRNNICVGNGSQDLWCATGANNDGTLGSGNVYENNCLGAEGFQFMMWGDGHYHDTYDDWETDYGGSTSSVEADPLMADPANDLFALQVTSPCIDTGADVSLTEDYPGRTVGASPDVGAYEFLSIAADTVAYAETGTAADTLFNRLITAATDSYTVTGGDATLTFSEISHTGGILVMGMGMELK